MSRRQLRWGLVIATLCVTGAMLGSSQESPTATAAEKSATAEKAPTKSASKSLTFDTTRRVPWTTSKVVGTPEPPNPYKLVPAFPQLKFSEPLHMTACPGSDRLFIAERTGKIYSFPHDQAASKPEVYLDLGKTVYSFTFHPNYAKNGYLYVTYVLDPAKPSPTGTRVSRFQVKPNDPLHADLKSEKIILEWPSGGHNGGNLAFGKDGYLYINTGDGSGIADELQTGQDISDLLASILRIDVDNVPQGKTYSIPADNPFVNTPGARGEIWAYGLRQSWKFSFDRITGDLWAGEVGQDLWEMVYKIEKGGNYGWSIREGAHPFRPERKLGPSPILPPVVEHPHSEYRSITGGYVYHGKKFPALKGAYIYGDYDTGKVASFKYDSKTKQVSEQQELADTPLRIVAFGEDNAGELYAVDFIGGGLHQLAPATAVAARTDFPRKLSETGLFTSTKDHTLAPGVIPYSVNAELWSDHAIKERFLAIPGASKIQFDAIEYPQPAPGAPRGWRFPDGTVAVKTFWMEMEQGNPASRRRLETRILHYEQTPGTQEVGDQVWRGYTYIWNDDQTDAILADKNGVDRELTVRDPAAPNGTRKQVWHFPSRTECTMCHTTPAKYVLGVNTLQLNKTHDYGNGVQKNQLAVFEDLGLFEKALPKKPAELPHLVNPHDTRQSLEDRARSYLHANCSHCHMKWGGGNAEFQLLVTLPLTELGIVNDPPRHGSFNVPGAKVLVPGNPEKSIMLNRMTRLGLGRMPHIASTAVDDRAVALIRDWIKQLPPDGKPAPK